MIQRIKLYSKYLLILIICITGVSCKERKPWYLAEPTRTGTAEGHVKLWNGQNFKINEIGRPVTIVWFKPYGAAWVSHKGFSNANEIYPIMKLLGQPDFNEPNPAIKTQNKLSLIFYKGSDELSIVELYFTIDGNDVFIGPAGKSRELGKILLAKEMSGHADYLFPHLDTGSIGETNISVFKKSVERLRTEKYKWDRGQEVNDMMIPYMVIHRNEDINRMEKYLIDRINQDANGQ